MKNKVEPEAEVSLAALFKMTRGTRESKPIPRHHLQGIVSVRRGEITEHGHPYAMLTPFSDGTAEITITHRLKDTKQVEVSFRHEIGHWVWLQFIPEEFKRDWRSPERFAKAYSEVFRRGSKSKPENLRELWSINAKQKSRNLALKATNSRPRRRKRTHGS